MGSTIENDMVNPIYVIQFFPPHLIVHHDITLVFTLHIHHHNTETLNLSSQAKVKQPIANK